MKAAAKKTEVTRSLGLGAWQDKTPPEQVQFRRGFCECRLEAEGVVQAVTSCLRGVLIGSSLELVTKGALVGVVGS
ncbi:hypothetical protein JCM18916_627 [Cutibacterium acnes JCM 18916]|nr:hypothetical protein JCM18916_627 [Cutibacterium acnes JCM 18916]